MKQLYQFILAAFFLTVTANLQAQPGAPIDERARELVSLGKKHFKSSKYLDASLTFELATQRPYNRLTTLAWYMTGLSYYKLGEQDKATEAFNRLLKDYPQTRGSRGL